MQENKPDSSFVTALLPHLPAVIQVASVIAAIIASWTLLGRDIDDLKSDIVDLRTMINLRIGQTEVRAGAAETRLYEIEKEQAQDDIRFENLRDTVNELRRRASLPETLPQ